MIPETKEAVQELAQFISEAITLRAKAKDNATHLKEITDECSKRWDISPVEFKSFVDATDNRTKVSSKADLLNSSLEFVDGLQSQ